MSDVSKLSRCRSDDALGKDLDIRRRAAWLGDSETFSFEALDVKRKRISHLAFSRLTRAASHDASRQVRCVCGVAGVCPLDHDQILHGVKAKRLGTIEFYASSPSVAARNAPSPRGWAQNWAHEFRWLQIVRESALSEASPACLGRRGSLVRIQSPRPLSEFIGHL